MQYLEVETKSLFVSVEQTSPYIPTGNNTVSSAYIKIKSLNTILYFLLDFVQAGQAGPSPGFFPDHYMIVI